MKKTGVWVIAALLAAGCQKSEIVSEFTGTESTYSLAQSSQFAISGTITFRERKDGKITAAVQLAGTEGNVLHPVHLHLGNISKPGADIALLLNPVHGQSGKSETTFDKLADESTIDYASLQLLDACVKIHLGDVGADRDVILAAGNIGASFAAVSGGRFGVAACKSE
jgi:hypothetical protein